MLQSVLTRAAPARRGSGERAVERDPDEVVAERAEFRRLLETPNLTHLVADLGGVPRFFEFLARVLAERCGEWGKEHGGLNDAMAKTVHSALLTKLQDRYGLEVWQTLLAPSSWTKQEANKVVTRLFTVALSGLEVPSAAPVLPGAATFADVQTAGLITFFGIR